MNRSQWKFPMLGSTLVEPARDCLNYHRDRLDWWKEELDDATTKLKSDGITISDRAEASAFGNSSMTYRGDMDINVDFKLKQRVDECKVKVREHQEAEREFDRWLRAFEKNPEGRYELDIDDMNYFRI